MPYVSEEVWSWWREGSIHRASWPNAADLRGPGVGDGDDDGVGGDPLVYEVAAAVLAEVRKVKSTQKVSLAAPVARVCVVDTAERIAALEAARRRRAATRARSASSRPRSVRPFSVRVDLAEPQS